MKINNRFLKRIKFFGVATLAATSLVITACKDKDSAKSGSGSSTAKSTVTNKELKVGISQEFENLNPIISQMLATTHLYAIAGRNLVTIDPDGNWIPLLVEKVPSLENGLAKFIEVDGKKTIEATWRIRDDQFWGDGKPVLAEDVKFSWNVGKHPNVSVGQKEVYEKIVTFTIDPADPKKFVTVYDKARWDFYTLGTFYVLPKHIEKPIFDKHVDKPLGYEKNTAYVTDSLNPGLYNGPYVLEEIKLGSHVSFVPNKHWKGHPPKIQKIIYKYMPNTATLEANIRSGTIDMIDIIGLKFDQAIKFEKTVNDKNLALKVMFQPGLTYEHIDLQLKNPILQDVRVRKALVYGINRDELTKALFENKQTKAIHNLAPVDPWYTDDPEKIVLYPYSPRKAKKLLEEAGWKLGADGVREKDGKRLSLQIMTTSGDKTRELVQSYLQDQWKKIGLELTIKNEPARVYFGETIRKSKYPAMAMFAWISSPENNPKSTLASVNIPTQKNGYSGQNSPGWNNAKVDKLLEEVDREFSAEKRKDKIAKVMRYYTDEVPVIPLYYRSDIAVVPNNLVGYRIPGHQFGPTRHVEKWELK